MILEKCFEWFLGEWLEVFFVKNCLKCFGERVYFETSKQNTFAILTLFEFASCTKHGSRLVYHRFTSMIMKSNATCTTITVPTVFQIIYVHASTSGAFVFHFYILLSRKIFKNSFPLHQNILNMVNFFI